MLGWWNGIHVCLRCICLRAWEFESPLQHQKLSVFGLGVCLYFKKYQDFESHSSKIRATLLFFWQKRVNSFLSSKKQIQSAYEISIKNNKTTAIEVTLTDQVPLATDANMEVEIDELSGGSLNKETGMVEWKLTLKPGEQVKKKLAYKVKIPKDKSITL